MDLRSAWKEAAAELRRAGVPSPLLAAEVLLLHVLERTRTWLYAHPEATLDPEQLERYRQLVARRAAGIPTQYLTGRQEFWGLDFEVTPDVLIPRPETEHLVEVVLERLGQQRAAQPLRVVDVGTGSGCLAVALARELPQAGVWATDISRPALAVAARNAARHGVAERLRLVHADLLESFEERSFDVVVSNPPYVGRLQADRLPREVVAHEPAVALFAGEEGVELYPRLIAGAARVLRPGGLLVIELSDQVAGRVRALCLAELWERVAVSRDLAGIERVLAAERR